MPLRISAIIDLEDSTSMPYTGFAPKCESILSGPIYIPITALLNILIVSGTSETGPSLIVTVAVP
ncbi:MAG: hypothetical protein QXX64_04750 [Nitrososphaera sp.]|uniref:hypothetical protein n=1 Tax=Candidatus Nitrososphaera gargensis TaxID=497727 RepID=UPI0011E530CA|nr:hypothetical protein [Candidatus Nitrososphaera gargensis]